MELNELIPKQGQHAVFCGINGCGKTTLALVLLKFRQSVLIYDPKCEIKVKGIPVFRSLRKLISAHPLKGIYAPSDEEVDDPVMWDRFYKYAYKRKRTTVYTDEVYNVCKRDEMPRYYRMCLVRGRSRKVECWNSTQRPMEVPNFIFSESKNFYCFMLALSGDREKVEKMTGISREAIFKLPEHQFIYARPNFV